ncbi:Thioredoxin [Candidatus Anstonella stagnisolia]|nr:Thioredoxin [Candidatus Anstonella stagnisolia]
MADTKTEIAKGEYIIGIAVILAALLVSATIYIAAGNLTDALAKKNFAVTVQQAAAAAAPAVAAGNNAPAAAPAPAPVNIDVTGFPFRGGANAKVLIVEYSDFQCPFCERVNPTVSQILSTYGNDVKLVYKNFPLEQLHPNAEKAAEASECARDQGKFWEMHDAMFADQNKLGVADLKATAATLGMDAAKFNACLDGGQKASVVSAEAQEGADNGVQGTPTFYINGVQVVGAQPFSAFKSAIDAALAK